MYLSGLRVLVARMLALSGRPKGSALSVCVRELDINVAFQLSMYQHVIIDNIVHRIECVADVV